MSTRALARSAGRTPRPQAGLRAALLAALLLAGQAAAQDAAPEAEEAPTAPQKPKPKPAPKPKPQAKPAEKAAEKPADAKPEAAPAVWPAGADTVSETYGEWTTNCARAEARTSCLVTQSQGDRQSGRRQFVFELRTPQEGRAEGLILMPFGLNIETGVTFKLDESVLGKGAPYTTCTSEGCLVPISFPTLATDAMKTAKALVVNAQKANSSETVTITLPLGGFNAAFARATALGS
ncbi:invasion associated locus B family protein [Methylobacterium radiodurans]|uniref:Invasion protein n=1 Tax=Methylobacterium radiodurans TaxID=2202828 RepID=A0A2U8VTE8_9HYPH|nr:invasion associated locus B family protein [Methylobacterium radiodurans]AWN36985.1 invasion protein [Methylobacterium radiodurans]